LKPCVVVPTYNERQNVRALVDKVKSVGVPGLTLLFVDDSSPDGTADEIREISLREPWVRILVRDSKKGIGSAYRDGFRHAGETLDPDALVEMDADLQHPPAVLPELLKAIDAGADVAIASRYVPGGGVEGWGRGRRVVSRGANAYARFALRLSVRDCTSGFRAYARGAAATVVESSLPAKGFEFQVATLYLLRKSARMVEVPYTFSYRRAGKSKLGLGDMTRFFFNVLRLSLG
jgi:dolichol-phosphate mannosyltransferase